MELAAATVLIVEDGDEYLDNYTRHVVGPTYLQAHSAAEALAILGHKTVDLLLLDMRFDRVPRATLVGDHAQASRELGGDSERAWRHLSHHQGLYVLAEIRAAGFVQIPVLLAYDFSREIRRFDALRRNSGNIDWLPDAASADVLRKRMQQML